MSSTAAKHPSRLTAGRPTLHHDVVGTVRITYALNSRPYCRERRVRRATRQGKREGERVKVRRRRVRERGQRRGGEKAAVGVVDGEGEDLRDGDDGGEGGGGSGGR